jgi:cysteine desulfurase family protein (TIGR01976 family)
MPYTEVECQQARQVFPSLARTVNGLPIAYLDGPAGTQVPEPVIEAISGYYRTSNANQHGPFVTSRETDQVIAGTRDAVAAFLGAPSGREISFGANMTSLTFALSHALVREMQPGDEIVITRLDHEANRGPWLLLAERGIVIREVALRLDGTLDPEDFARQVTERTRLVAVGAASNALGTVNDLALARRLASSVGAWLLVDAVHYAAHFPVDVQAIDCDFLLCSAYKFYGPHVGLLYSRPGLLGQLRTDKLCTQDDEAPYRIETGTLNHAALAGVKAAIDFIATWGRGTTLRERIVTAMDDIAAYEHGLAAHYYDAVRRIRRARVWGPGFSSRHRAPTVSFSIEGRATADIARKLGEAGLQVWGGHFYARCAIETLGLTATGGVVRTGICMYNTREEIERLIDAIVAL